MDSSGDVLDSFRAVVGSIESSAVSQESLGSADVGSGLLSSDVLLSGLQGHTDGGLASVINGGTNDTS